ncbi:MAG: polyprenyl synthetase family protein [Gemmatimonadaceae bacterium]|jgi:octaprenyl-diphosphate synthase|nr:polyprenyl synthetase family protein [Gemmatimonadaceae bacterium]
MTLPVPARVGLQNPLAEIQRPVHAELDRVVERMWAVVHDDNALIQDVNRHLQRMQGKLLRPTLLLLANATGARRSTVAIDHAAVIELIHLATLVHDDSVDHSGLRRGMPTVNAAFSHQVSVMMGDFIYSRAVRHLVRLGELEALQVIAEASNTMTVGELWQLATIDALAFDEAEYYRLNHAKTATLMSAACEVGAMCGAPEHREALARYGERLGMAFQVADDLLDYVEGQEITGKPSGADLREHKVTLPLIAALPNMSVGARADVEALFASAVPDDEGISRVVGHVVAAGGIEYARQRGESFALEAEEAVIGLPESAARTALLELVGYVLDRRW